MARTDSKGPGGHDDDWHRRQFLEIVTSAELADLQSLGVPPAEKAARTKRLRIGPIALLGVGAASLLLGIIIGAGLGGETALRDFLYEDNLEVVPPAAPTFLETGPFSPDAGAGPLHRVWCVPNPDGPQKNGILHDDIAIGDNYGVTDIIPQYSGCPPARTITIPSARFIADLGLAPLLK